MNLKGGPASRPRPRLPCNDHVHGQETSDDRDPDLRSLCRNSLRADDAGAAGGLSRDDRGARGARRAEQDLDPQSEVGEGNGPLGAYFRTGYSLSEREREIAVCIINSKWHSIYPTAAHERAGKAAGLPAEKVEAILSGLPASFSDRREQVVYEMAMCLANSRWVPKGLYDRAVDALGHNGVTDVICLMGFYTSVSMTLAFYDVPAGATGMAR